MNQDWNQLESTRDLVDFAKGMDQHRATQETVATRKLLEEQVRLQREANELEKRRLALEEEKIKRGLVGQTPSMPPTPSPSNSPSQISSREEPRYEEPRKTEDQKRPVPSFSVSSA